MAHDQDLARGAGLKETTKTDKKNDDPVKDVQIKEEEKNLENESANKTKAPQS